MTNPKTYRCHVCGFVDGKHAPLCQDGEPKSNCPKCNRPSDFHNPDCSGCKPTQPVPREWQIFDGHTANPILLGPDIAYADSPKVIEKSAYDELMKNRHFMHSEWCDAVEARDKLAAELADCKAARQIERDRWEKLEAENARLIEAWGRPNTEIIAERHRYKVALVTIECGLVTTEETAQYAGLRPKEIARMVLEKK